jgi:hypothetical protein
MIDIESGGHREPAEDKFERRLDEWKKLVGICEVQNASWHIDISQLLERGFEFVAEQTVTDHGRYKDVR